MASIFKSVSLCPGYPLSHRNVSFVFSRRSCEGFWLFPVLMFGSVSFRRGEQINQIFWSRAVARLWHASVKLKGKEGSERVDEARAFHLRSSHCVCRKIPPFIVRRPRQTNEHILILLDEVFLATWDQYSANDNTSNVIRVVQFGTSTHLVCQVCHVCRFWVMKHGPLPSGLTFMPAWVGRPSLDTPPSCSNHTSSSSSQTPD